MTRFFTAFSVFILCLACLTIKGCSYADYGHKQATAKRLSAPVFMLPRHVPTDSFYLQAYERVHKPGSIAHVYIEGDGHVWLGENTPQTNPTPTNPVALHLATRDNSQNVIYLARPCQYIDRSKEPNCNELVWTSDRYSEDVVHSMNQALENIKRRYNLSGFHLVGYDGGAAIATLVTPLRDDILSIRTVGGILDHDAWTHMRDRAPLINSLNPIYVAESIRNVPQHHFIGGIDYNVTPDIFWRYYETSHMSPCVRATIVQNADHDAGWVDRWPSLLKEPVDCQKPEMNYNLFAP